jgi:nitroimidazol reductase NimA-like FMN-containing flavoprotein (pyridoxamine 5'-phosphate oxidase superfamily)
LEDSPELSQLLHDLMATRNFGVLCTEGQGQPYGSLMCFATSDDLARVWLATERNTLKFKHMHANDRVAFLVENTGNEPSDTFEAVVATATGRVSELEGAEKSAALERYLAKNPQLTEFLASPGCALLQLEVEAFQVVRRFQEAVQVRVG